MLGNVKYCLVLHLLAFTVPRSNNGMVYYEDWAYHLNLGSLNRIKIMALACYDRNFMGLLQTNKKENVTPNPDFI